MFLNGYIDLNNEVTAFRDNLKKDNVCRRQDIRVTNRKLQEFSFIKTFKQELCEKISCFDCDPKSAETINDLVTQINKKIGEIEKKIRNYFAQYINNCGVF